MQLMNCLYHASELITGKMANYPEITYCCYLLITFTHYGPSHVESRRTKTNINDTSKWKRENESKCIKDCLTLVKINSSAVADSDTHIVYLCIIVLRPNRCF